ncbi:TonB-dependent receptor [Halioglobus maricola]|uniref:TonB-dependent receptor n=1 Tax=Halioglobus maricola TaxID=2601894 RepID=A0A5P9NNG3_9GAMM|nr:TonB-dependent receptor [Halioglobus maricola]QFU77312.1 TonB-dependent receptor [Halioglobus maricola]
MNTLKTALALAVAGVSVAANAQLEEVIVTAQKKSESLQDAPIAISAFTAENLEQIGATSAVDVGEYTPNAWITRSLGSSYNIRVSIRGIGTAEPSLAVDPKVGVYLDGAYIARNAGAVFDVVDLERVEVLRGPQGTLWGKNTTGGAINLVTQQPSGEFGGKVDFTVGNFGSNRAAVTVDTGEAAGLAAKISYVKKVSDGWQDNISDIGEDELGSEDTDAFRLAVRWDITDTLSANYAYDRTDGEATAPATQVGFVDASTDPSVPTIDLGDFSFYGGNLYAGMAEIANDDDRLDKFDLDNMKSEEVEISGHNLTLSWMLGDLEIKSITAYRDYESDQNGLDLDGGNWVKFSAADGTPSPATGFHTVGEKEQDQFSQEFQFLGTALDDRLDYVVGLYYFDEEGREINPWQATFYNAANNINTLFNGNMGAWYEITGESQALYGQATYHFSEAWRLTLGARYTEDEKELILLEEDPGLDQDYSSKEDWSKTTGAATLAYFMNDDVNFYGKVAQGYAAGIYNPGTVGRGVGPANPEPALTPADPEETTSYELGAKSQLADGMVRLNAAVYYNDNENLQQTDFVDGVRRTINSGESETIGAEIDVTALLGEHWMVTANAGYSDSDYDDSSRETEAFKTGAAGVQYDTDTNLGHVTARFDATYMGKVGFSASDPRVHSDARTLFNARLTLSEVEALDGQFRFALWGKNLADEEYIEHGANYGSFTGYTWGTPRTYGLDVAYEF